MRLTFTCVNIVSKKDNINFTVQSHSRDHFHIKLPPRAPCSCFIAFMSAAHNLRAAALASYTLLLCPSRWGTYYRWIYGLLQKLYGDFYGDTWGVFLECNERVKSGENCNWAPEEWFYTSSWCTPLQLHYRDPYLIKFPCLCGCGDFNECSGVN